MDTASRKTGELDGRAKEMKQSILADLKELVGLDTTDETVIPGAVNAKLKELDLNAAELKEQISAAEKQVQRRAEINERLPELQENETQCRKKTAETGQLIAAADASRKEIRARISVLSEKLGFESRNAAVKEADALKKAEERIKKEAEQKRRELDRCAQIVAGYMGRKTVLEQQLSDVPEIDISREMQRLDDARRGREDIQRRQKSLNAMLLTNRNCLERLGTVGRELDEVRKALTAMKALSDTANGTVSGREKITLETYVQTAYFERMLKRANQRLLKMTNGQYQLRRREEPLNKAEKTGLDLDIADNFNGSVRDVRTLSGGESFMAALALAFGLSDEIQSRSSIRLDTMFIDEGFGSLHQSALDSAVSVLAEMSGTNRLIGIISHVEDLKSRIDKQICVTKGIDPDTGAVCTQVKLNFS